jgi:hypothetical protein
LKLRGVEAELALVVPSTPTPMIVNGPVPAPPEMPYDTDPVEAWSSKSDT